MLWINFLHLYQPANVEEFHIKEALDKSYWRLIRLLEENPSLKMTFNVSGCLLNRLEEMGELSFIKALKKIYQEGRLELVSSAAYHGFLPLLPEEETRRQIFENEEILKKFFGSDFQAKGFFLPEMAYSLKVAKIVKELNYEWLILGQISAQDQDIDFKQVFLDKKSGLKIIFRNRNFSRAYPPDKIVEALNKEEKSVVISATDAELYGLRHEDPTGEVEQVVKNTLLKTKTISQFISSFSEESLKKIKIRESSWESEESEILKGNAFSLWSSKNNKIHRDLWRLAYLALSLEKKFPYDENLHWYRWHLVRGLASCTFWWASAKDFSIDFGPYAWNPDIVERGLHDLLRSVRSINNKKSIKDKLRAEKLCLKIKKRLWQEHWLKHWN